MDENPKLGFVEILGMTEGTYNGTVDDLRTLIDESFAETVKRVLSTGKAGKLTVTLGFNRVDDFRIEIKGDVSAKLPEPKTDGRRFYHDVKGNITADDPRQRKLPFPALKQIKKEETAIC